MEKVKKVFVCRACGVTSPKWEGKCHSCGAWNAMVEEIIRKTPDKKSLSVAGSAENQGKGPRRLNEIEAGDVPRLISGDRELDRVLGGGIVPGSLVLIAGYPGIGKSTLLLQIALKEGVRVLYVSGEESEEQIKMRVERVGKINPECYLYNETNLDAVLQSAATLKPDILIVDSIQTLSHPYLDSTPGSISQIRECTGELQRYAKKNHLPVIIVGHINKEGDIAGPKLLEHIVDTVLHFEGDRNNLYRILRTRKNRFGSTDELGIYEMRSTGLREVDNPSELLVSQKDEALSGSAITCTIEGSRPMLIEIQALVSGAVYGTSQRSATGFDNRRLNMLLAVLEKRGGVYFSQKDVFMNITGGIRVDDPAMDLGIAAALVSSHEDIALSPLSCYTGEIGLSGEIRAVSRIEQRIQEAARLGYEEIYISTYNAKGLKKNQFPIRIIPLQKVTDLVGAIIQHR